MKRRDCLDFERSPRGYSTPYRFAQGVSAFNVACLAVQELLLGEVEGSSC